MAPGHERRLDPRPALDAAALQAAFRDAGVKPSHAPTVRRYVIETFRRWAAEGAEADGCGPGGFGGLGDKPYNVPHAGLDVLASGFTPCSSREVLWSARQSRGSGKLVIELQDGERVEAVVIEHGGRRPRSTVCLSCQVGCRMGCRFCATGSLGLRAQLSAGEILEQLLHAVRRASPGAPLRNVVFMGMGEPLDNYEEVLSAVRVMTARDGFNLAPKNVTVSTVGVPRRIVQLAADCPGVNLALSLHAPTQEIRERIVPSARGNNLQRLMDAVDLYSVRAGGRKVMMEYILIDGVNASDADAHALGGLLAERQAWAMVNLIPYNPTTAGDGHTFCPPSEERCKSFRDIVASYRRRSDVPGAGAAADAKAGAPILCTVRWSTVAGQSNSSACGQLSLVTAPPLGGQGGARGCVGDIEDAAGAADGGLAGAEGAGAAASPPAAEATFPAPSALHVGALAAAAAALAALAALAVARRAQALPNARR